MTVNVLLKILFIFKLGSPIQHILSSYENIHQESPLNYNYTHQSVIHTLTTKTLAICGTPDLLKENVNETKNYKTNILQSILVERVL